MMEASSAAAAEHQASLAPVSVVITCYNHGRWLADAITSVLHQTCPPAELIVVDDGSTDDTAAVCACFPGARYVHQPNSGLAAARNRGLDLATGSFVCFLDADDRLLGHAIENGMAALEAHPRWAFTFGGYRVIDGAGEHLRTVSAERGEVPYRAFLEMNRVGMHATVLYRLNALREAGRFDTGLRASEDYDMMLRIARRAPVGSHGVVVAEYRQHGENMSSDAERMLTSSLAVLRAQRELVLDAGDRRALDAGLRAVARHYGVQLVHQALLDLPRPTRTLSALRRLEMARRTAPQAFLAVVNQAPRSISRLLARRLPVPLKRRVRAALERAAGRPVRGRVDFGDLRRLKPIDPDFGFGRGLPIDRFYIEHFLAQHAGDMSGRVLEIEDNRYTVRFGGDRVTRSEVLNLTGTPGTTIVADLTDAPNVAESSFDCAVLTQTLQYISGPQRAIATLHRILRPGGVLLVTVPGLSKLDRDERRDGWYWLVTEAGLRHLLGAGWSEISIETYGNVLSAVGFLQGVAAEELEQDELLARDPCYQVVVAARAVRAPNGE